MCSGLLYGGAGGLSAQLDNNQETVHACLSWGGILVEENHQMRCSRAVYARMLLHNLGWPFSCDIVTLYSPLSLLRIPLGYLRSSGLPSLFHRQAHQCTGRAYILQLIQKLYVELGIRKLALSSLPPDRGEEMDATSAEAAAQWLVVSRPF